MMILDMGNLLKNKNVERRKILTLIIDNSERFFKLDRINRINRILGLEYKPYPVDHVNPVQ